MLAGTAGTAATLLLFLLPLLLPVLVTSTGGAGTAGAGAGVGAAVPGCSRSGSQNSGMAYWRTGGQRKRKTPNFRISEFQNCSRK